MEPLIVPGIVLPRSMVALVRHRECQRTTLNVPRRCRADLKVVRTDYCKAGKRRPPKELEAAGRGPPEVQYRRLSGMLLSAIAAIVAHIHHRSG